MKKIIRILWVLFVFAPCYAADDKAVDDTAPHHSIVVPIQEAVSTDFSEHVAVSSGKRCSWLRCLWNSGGACFNEVLCRKTVLVPLAVVTVAAGVGVFIWHMSTSSGIHMIDPPPLDKICIQYMKGFYISENCWQPLYLNSDAMPDYYACVNYPVDIDYIDAPSPPRIPGALCAEHIDASSYYVPFSGNFTLLFSGLRWSCSRLTDAIFGCSG